MTSEGSLAPLRPRRPDVIDEVFDGEAVVVQLRTGCYYAFNPAASRVWALLQDGRSPATIATALGSPAVVTFCEQLVAEELVEAAPAEAPVAVVADDAFAEHPALQRFTDMQDLLLLDPIHDIDLDGDGWPLAPASPA